jgi:hypothetical protein
MHVRVREHTIDGAGRSNEKAVFFTPLHFLPLTFIK